MSFQCLIDKSAVVWENEVRSTFLSGLFWSTRDPIFRNLAGKPDLQTGKIKVLKSFQATIMNSSVDQVKKKKIAFLQGNFDNARFSENNCFAVYNCYSVCILSCMT